MFARGSGITSTALPDMWEIVELGKRPHTLPHWFNTIVHFISLNWQCVWMPVALKCMLRGNTFTLN